MKKMLIVLFIVAGLAFSGCVTTSQTDSLNKTKSLDEMSAKEIREYNNDPNNYYKIVCTTETRPGTRIAKRVCSKQRKTD